MALISLSLLRSSIYTAIMLMKTRRYITSTHVANVLVVLL